MLVVGLSLVPIPGTADQLPEPRKETIYSTRLVAVAAYTGPMFPEATGAVLSADNSKKDNYTAPTPKKPRAATPATVVAAQAPKGNGFCLPYARATTGIQVFGAAKDAPDKARAAGYVVSRELQAPTGMVVTNEGGWAKHAEKYTDLGDGWILLHGQNYAGKYVVTERKMRVYDTRIIDFIAKPELVTPSPTPSPTPKPSSTPAPTTPINGS